MPVFNLTADAGSSQVKAACAVSTHKRFYLELIFSFVCQSCTSAWLNHINLHNKSGSSAQNKLLIWFKSCCVVCFCGNLRGPLCLRDPGCPAEPQQGASQTEPVGVDAVERLRRGATWWSLCLGFGFLKALVQMLLYWATSPPRGGSGEQRLQLLAALNHTFALLMGMIQIKDDNCLFAEPAHPGSHGSRRRHQ